MFEQFRAPADVSVAPGMAMTDEEIISIEIAEWLSSAQRAEMLDGMQYYRAENGTIAGRVMLRMENGVEKPDRMRPNNKLRHAVMKTLVDDKINYLLAKPYSLVTDDRGKDTVQPVLDALGPDFQYILTRLGYEAANKGVGWLYVYAGDDGAPRMQVVPSEQVIPLWADDDHTELDALIRVYDVVAYVGRKRELLTKVEYYTPDEVRYYQYDNGVLIPDPDRPEEQARPHLLRGGTADGFGRVPWAAFRNNWLELPDLHFVRSLVDNYDFTRSDNANMLDEMRKMYWVLKGYGGTDLAEFRRNLDAYGVISIADGSEGNGAEAIPNSSDLSGFDRHFEQLKADLLEYGQGVNKRMDDVGKAPSGVALRFLYSGLDLKCNALEVEFQRGFRRLLELLRVLLPLPDAEAKLVFNRDISINETEAIDQCGKSKGVISDETIVANHPWVSDVEAELARLAEQEHSEQAALDPWRGEEPPVDGEAARM